MQKFARLAISSGAIQFCFTPVIQIGLCKACGRYVPCRNSGQATVLSITSFNKVNLPAPGNLNTRDLAL